MKPMTDAETASSLFDQCYALQNQLIAAQARIAELEAALNKAARSLENADALDAAKEARAALAKGGE